MQLSTIRYFMEVARSQSIREAADKLRIAPSAVSRQIAQLESEFAQPLFERHARGIKLTEAGVVVQKLFREILLDIDEIHEQLDEIRGLRRGRVRVATIEGAIAGVLMRAISDLHQNYPAITFEVLASGTTDAAEALLRDDVDLMIAYNVEPNAGIEILVTVEQQLYAVVADKQALRGLRAFSLKDVANVPIAYPSESFGIRLLMDRALHGMGIVLKPALISNSIEALKAFVREGMGVTFLPRFPVTREVETGEFRLLPIAEAASVTASLIVATRRDRRLPPAARELVEHLRPILERLS